jgi:hypothetical protein
MTTARQRREKDVLHVGRRRVRRRSDEPEITEYRLDSLAAAGAGERDAVGLGGRGRARTDDDELRAHVAVAVDHAVAGAA